MEWENGRVLRSMRLNPNDVLRRPDIFLVIIAVCEMKAVGGTGGDERESAGATFVC